ncbi:hypothetical protein CDAR_379641, partial [Caerostris darwini]
MSGSLSSGTYQALEVTCRLLRSTQVTRTNTNLFSSFILFVYPLLPEGYGVEAREGFELIKQK